MRKQPSSHPPQALFQPPLFSLCFNSYGLEKALQLCEQHRITDAIVFLLERMGDISGALVLILDAVQERIVFLSEGVKFSFFPSFFSLKCGDKPPALFLGVYLVGCLEMRHGEETAVIPDQDLWFGPRCDSALPEKLTPLGEQQKRVPVVQFLGHGDGSSEAVQGRELQDDPELCQADRGWLPELYSNHPGEHDGICRPSEHPEQNLAGPFHRALLGIQGNHLRDPGELQLRGHPPSDHQSDS